MPTCRRQRGFSYLLLLFTLVLGGIALATLGERWQVALQRERETELLFRGGEIRRAIERYHAVLVKDVASWPTSLDELLDDRRQDEPRYHLRRLYADPFTGTADWELVTLPDGALVGVRSRSRMPALRQHDLPVTMAPRPEAAGPPNSVGDWLFVAAGAEPPVP